MTSPNVQRVLDAHRVRPIDGDAVSQTFASMRTNPDELVELLNELIGNCQSVRTTTWLFPPACGSLPLSRMDELAEHARLHLAAHEGCDAATTFLAHFALRRPSDSPERAWHLSLPSEYLAQRVDRWRFRVGHPTWVALTDDHAQALVGGEGGACPRCGGVAERLLRLPAASLSGVLSSVRDVSFIWCGWCSPYVSTATFSSVEVDGTPTMLPLDLLIDPGSPEQIDVAPEMPVGLVDLGPEWYRQDWMWANGVENLYRVGGEPTWIQNPAVPSCPACGEQMAFVAQLDVADMTNGEGLAYLFWCDKSAVSAVVFQQT